MALNRNVLIIMLAAACAAIGVLGYKLYEENRKTTGVEINVGPRGLSIEQK